MAAFAACAAASTFAQSVGSTLAPVEIRGNYDNAVGSSDAASQGSVSARLIATRPTERTGEILEFVPGLIVSQHSGDGKANQYYLRGFNLDHGTDFATFVDGMPVNMRSHAHGQGYTDLNFLIPELVSRIDYRKGPYYAEEGDFASAGAAHLRLMDTLPAGIASLTLGQNRYTRALLAKSTAAGAGQLLYALDLARNDGPWVNPERLRKFNGLLRYSQGTRDEGFNVTAMGYSARWNATDQIPQRAVDAGLVDRYGAIDATDGGESSRYSVSAAMRQRNALGLLEVNAYAIRSRLDLFSNFTYYMDDPVGGDQFEQKERRSVAGLNLSQTWNMKLAGFDAVNRVGLQTRYDRVSPVGLYRTTARVQTSLDREDRVRETSAGVFAENTTQWHEKFRTVAGVRWDRYRFDVASNIAANSGKAGDHLASPKLSFIVGPWAKTEYFLNWGEGFHSNDARGTTQVLTPKDLLPTTPVTPLVKTRGSEIGLRTELVPGLQSSVALWRLRIASELVFVGDAGDTAPSRPSARHGVEWNNHYVADNGLLLDADFAISRSRYTQDDAAGNFIPGSIEKVVSLGVTIVDRGPWSGSVQLRYFGPRPLVEDNSVRSSSTVLTNARVAYKLDAKTRVALDVFNLFNRKASDIDYYYDSQLRGEASPVTDRVFHPVEPRAFRVTLTHNF
ncbi:TonB-dependent receptor [Caenimonas sp. DR4.4]|uniref:TonB-dependent receptor n=2 Tax=Caenimonas aquaedulcis TaxID=2793270 RepID=A0A931H4T7_9BURK|nr:TonB-dependent receptor [Caenimonas aquaedulcis]MBG9388586.1 TonB-dependent receptor [Caenimonas aquaedulcis]